MAIHKVRWGWNWGGGTSDRNGSGYAAVDMCIKWDAGVITGMGTQE